MNSVRIVEVNQKIEDTLINFKKKNWEIEDHMHVEPEIPVPPKMNVTKIVEKNASKAQKRLPLKENEIIGLIDLTVTGTSKYFIIFCNAIKGIYYNNPMGSKKPGCDKITYNSFKSQMVELSEFNEIILGRSHFLNVSVFAGNKKKKETLVELLNDLSSELAQGDNDETVADEIRVVLKNNKDFKYLSLLSEPHSEESKINKVKKRCEIFRDEIIGIIDLTVRGSMKHCFVFGAKGIYYHNPWGSYAPGPGYLPYRVFKKCKFDLNGKYEISLGDYHSLNVSFLAGLNKKVEKIINIFEEVQVSLRGLNKK